MDIKDVKYNIDDFFRKNKRIAFTLCVIGLLLSSFFTYLSFLTKSDPSLISVWGMTISLVALGSTLLIDGSKTTFFVAYEKTGDKKYLYAWIVAIAFSITFSLAFFTMQEAQEENKTNNSTILFNERKAEKDRIDAQIKTKTGLLEAKKAEKAAVISSLSQQRQDNQNRFNSLSKSISVNKGLLQDAQVKLKHDIGKGWYGQQDADNAEISRVQGQITSDTKARDSLGISGDTSKIDADIEKYGKEIDDLIVGANKIKYDVMPNEKMDSTMIPLLSKLNFIGIGKSTMIFDFLKSIVIDVFTCYLYNIANLGIGTALPSSPTPPTGSGPGRKLKDKVTRKVNSLSSWWANWWAKKKSVSPTPTNLIEKNNLEPEKKPEKIDPPKNSGSGSQSTGLEKTPKNPPEKPPKKQPENIVQFQPRNPPEQPKNPPKKDKEINMYLTFALNNLKPDGDFVSRGDIARGTGLSEEACRRIANTLKKEGVIQTSLNPRRTWLNEAEYKKYKAT